MGGGGRTPHNAEEDGVHDGNMLPRDSSGTSVGYPVECDRRVSSMALHAYCCGLCFFNNFRKVLYVYFCLQLLI